MDSKQVSTAFDKYFRTLEQVGTIDSINKQALWDVMFIDEYYEYLLGESTSSSQLLTDDIVKKLNTKLECIYQKSCIFKGNRFSPLPGFSHWYIPSGPTNYISGTTFVLTSVANSIATTSGTVTNNTLTI